MIVATDDERIAEAVRAFGGQVVMTRKDHPSGTDRVAEVAADLDAEIIVKVQAVEPDIEPACIDRLVDTSGAAGAGPPGLSDRVHARRRG